MPTTKSRGFKKMADGGGGGVLPQNKNGKGAPWKILNFLWFLSGIKEILDPSA